MKLQIVEKFWSVGYPTVTKTRVKVPLQVGRIPGVERWKMHFTIDSVTDAGVEVTVHYEEKKYNQTWLVTKDQGIYYRPISMDGGYEYYIDLKQS